MSNRKGIGKKLRFEVFKRDRFTCQYCGAAAPEAILHVDHISPVSKGGGNDILNLITSCASCNLGKSDRLLSDDSEIARQRAQLEELSARREQLEEMLRWREGLKSIDDDVYEAAADAWAEAVHGYTLNETGERSMRKLLRKFELSVILQAIDKVAGQYLRYTEEGPTQDSVEYAFSKLGGLCYFLANPEKASSRELYYIRGILRNRLSYVNEKMVLGLLSGARDLGADMDEVKSMACTASSWTAFREILEEYTEELSYGPH